MSRSSSPIYVSSCSASPELAYPNTGNTPFPPVSPTPFANNIPIPPMNTRMSTPSPTPQFVRDYKDTTNDAMVTHMACMMRMTPEEATAFVAMNQSILKPFLRGISPPPRPPIISTPEPLMVPPRYNNLSPQLPNYNLMESVKFPLPPPISHAPSPAETHVSYPPSPAYHIADDLDKFPNGKWPSNPPSPIPTSPSSDNAPILQAFIQTADNPIEA